MCTRIQRWMDIQLEVDTTYALPNVALSHSITRGPLRCARVTPSEIEGRRKATLRRKVRKKIPKRSSLSSLDVLALAV